ncbi:hypothetical protein MTO96_034768 [Rhipicephalus appendiculatus]
MRSSMILPSLASHTATVFSLVLTATISEAWRRQKLNATCPILHHCVCENGTYAVYTRCRHIADARQLDEDMAKLVGIPHKKLAFTGVNITDLPAEWLLNQRVTILNIFECPLRNISASAMERIQGLRKLRIEKGELESVPRGLAAARHLSILRVSENPIKALRGALSMPNLVELDLSHNAIETVDEEYLSGFRNLRRFILSRNNIRHLAPNMFQKTKKVKTIKLRNNILSSVDHYFHELLHLEGTGLLDLRGNGIETLDNTVKTAAPELKILSLKNNALKNLSVLSLPERLLILDLRGNNLERLPHSLLTERNLTALWLSDNPFVCDCDDYLLRRWIQVHGDTIKDIHDVVCAKSRNPFVARKNFVSLREEDLCPEMISRPTLSLLVVLGLVAVTLVLLSIYLFCKRNIKTWLHARGLACLTRCTTEDELDEEKLFDVFVSFSSRDQDFVHDNILPILEAHGISYCTNFVMSEWCRWEFRLAHQRALQDKVNRLIIILVDEFAPVSLNEDLKAYVRETNYLRWNETNFSEETAFINAQKGHHEEDD